MNHTCVGFSRSASRNVDVEIDEQDTHLNDLRVVAMSRDEFGHAFCCPVTGAPSSGPLRESDDW